MKTLMAALMVWASAQTGLPVPDAMPRIAMADSCEIDRLHKGDASRPCDQEGTRAVAIYDHRIDTIFLPDTWKADSLYHVSMLLHELVHHMQDNTGLNMETAPCPGRDLEKPAYEAQFAFLKAAGLDPMPASGLNKMAYFFIVGCEQDFR